MCKNYYGDPCREERLLDAIMEIAENDILSGNDAIIAIERIADIGNEQDD